MEDSYSVIISLEHHVPLDDADQYEEIIQYYKSRIVHGFDDQESHAGTFDFYVVNVSLAINRGVDIVDVADSIDQDLYNYCEALFEPETVAELREEVVEQFEYPAGSRLLILHLAKVLPEHRGRHLALVTAQKIIEQFGDGLVIAKAQPLQHHERFSDEKAMCYETFEPVPASALKRLERHWRRLGFEPIGKTGYLGLSTANKLPKPKLVLAQKKTQHGQPRARKPRSRKARK